jgi:hypothetical protein
LNISIHETGPIIDIANHFPTDFQFWQNLREPFRDSEELKSHEACDTLKATRFANALTRS